MEKVEIINDQKKFDYYKKDLDCVSRLSMVKNRKMRIFLFIVLAIPVSIMVLLSKILLTACRSTVIYKADIIHKKNTIKTCMGTFKFIPKSEREDDGRGQNSNQEEIT